MIVCPVWIFIGYLILLLFMSPPRIFVSISCGIYSEYQRDHLRIHFSVMLLYEDVILIKGTGVLARFRQC